MQWQKPMAETYFCRTGLNRGLNHLWQKLANPERHTLYVMMSTSGRDGWLQQRNCHGIDAV